MIDHLFGGVRSLFLIEGDFLHHWTGALCR